MPDQEDAWAILYLSGALFELSSCCNGVVASLASAKAPKEDMALQLIEFGCCDTSNGAVVPNNCGKRTEGSETTATGLHLIVVKRPGRTRTC